ncbi:Septin-domain-containing protein [Schizophyllum amplum]|uniref:Septin-domain-containing protein n=1 Tax=Schizophyllum amplum TaxID=97359 RepID=A0A550CGT6_9AGAR|nr:Septin-domain-containing protein [Auriculariopsis ampla]
MFSTFRRKPSKKEEPQPRIRATPSLPELHSQGIPWPENLVDANAMRQDVVGKEPTGRDSRRPSLHSRDHPPVSFHKPFRANSGSISDAGHAPDGTSKISSLYMPEKPAKLEFRKSVQSQTPSHRYTQRRARLPPTFNLMVVGGIGTGKTSLLRLLLETADLSPAATNDQRAALDRFLRGPPRTTGAIETACVEICESRFDRILLSVIDTPGLDFMEGHELKVERQVNNIMKYVDAQYADTMSEESKVVRQNKGDQHIHLCIYLIDPASVVTSAEHQARDGPRKRTRSESNVPQAGTSTPPELVPDTSSEPGDSDEEEDSEARLTMSKAEIRVIRRLSTRCNVLPVVARADSLTDENLAAVKKAVRHDLLGAGLGFGVFENARPKDQAEAAEEVNGQNGHAENQNGHVEEENGHAEVEAKEAHEEVKSTNGHAPEASSPTKDAASSPTKDAASSPIKDAATSPTKDTERQSRGVIKLRASRHRHASRSRSRRDLSVVTDDEPGPVADPESVANVRFSAYAVAKTDIGAAVPFALISPEGSRRGIPRRHSVASQHGRSQSRTGTPAPTSPDVEDAQGAPMSPGGVPRVGRFQSSPPASLKGVFVRKYRWGVIDVLDPRHCDFAMLRTAVLSTHLKTLKTRTKEVLYEKYRTEKLLARRATANISEDERNRLLEELGL